MRRQTFAALVAAALLAPAPSRAQTLVDVVNDTTDPLHRDDSEPSIAVNPVNPQEIAIVAFSGGWSATTNAPVFKSRDGGLTWTPITQLPRPAVASSQPGDQKIAFDAAGNLLVVELGLGLSAPRCYIYRQTAGPDAALTPGQVFGDDQPQLDSDNTAGSPFAGRRYAPWLDYSFTNPLPTVVYTLNNGVAVTNVGAGNNTSFPTRTTRIAVAPDGSAYIVYKTREGIVGSDFENAHFRVNRSDDGGLHWNGVGGTAGVSVHGAGTVVTWFTNSFGNPAKGKVGRARSSDAWIAVNPTNGDIWVAYCHRDASGFGQVYAVRSTTRGASWGAPVRVTDGTHHSAYPEIAVAANGAVGILYIDYDDSGAHTLFRHRFARSFNDGANWTDTLLQSMDPGPLSNASNGFLWGDYEGLAAAGHTFYGVFTGQSIGRATAESDPIFFRMSGVEQGRDVYVRDWTDSAASADDGAEPSTHASFYTTSDVWNKRTNTAPTFNASDQPDHETPNNGAGAAGTNYMFTRIHRNGGGPAETVNTHFMYSEFGVGSNYQDAGAPATGTVALAAAASSAVSGAHSWHLPSTTSNHLCLLVEIGTDHDPIQPPSLLNHAPGWPVSDRNVLNDNNKAQRNTEVNHETPEQVRLFDYYAIVHNPGLRAHDFRLAFSTTGGAAEVSVVGGNARATGEKGELTLTRVLPGENRWLAFRIRRDGGRAAAVHVSQLEAGRAVNGFEIQVEPAPLKQILAENLDARRVLFGRLGATFRNAGATAHAADVARAVEGADERRYRDLVSRGARVLSGLGAASTRSLQGTPFAFQDSLDEVRRALGGHDLAALAAADSAFLHRADAALTMVQKGRGDAADVLQMLEWQGSLSRDVGCGVDAGRALQAFRARDRRFAEVYASLVGETAACARKPRPATRDVVALQHLHRELLLALSGE